ncbi:MAG TPA: GGDEF domain-containing protein, partial [Actinotalea sp.]
MGEPSALATASVGVRSVAQATPSRETRPPGQTLVARTEFGPFDLLSDLAHAYYVEGFSARAVEACRQWVRLTDEAGDLATSRYLRYIEAIGLQELGRHAEAAEVSGALLASLGDAWEPVWRAKALAMVAQSSVRLGEHGRAIAAMAEADWLVRTVPPGSYGHLSASMAVALALRAVNLLEQADELLSRIGAGANPTVAMLVVQERALLSAYWGTTLWLIGHADEAGQHFVTAAGRARHMQRLAVAVGNDSMAARAEVIEAFAATHLGEEALGEVRALAAADRFTARPELIETHLLKLVLGRAAARAGDASAAHEHLSTMVAEADAAGREMWAAAGMATLADVEGERQGSHLGMDLWRSVARGALARTWSEREGRFAALRDRNRLRQLTAETDRIGEAMLQDPLTGLGNRRRLDLALGDAEPESAVFIDVDDFKAVNDA